MRNAIWLMLAIGMPALAVSFLLKLACIWIHCRLVKYCLKKKNQSFQMTQNDDGREIPEEKYKNTSFVSNSDLKLVSSNDSILEHKGSAENNSNLNYIPGNAFGELPPENSNDQAVNDDDTAGRRLEIAVIETICTNEELLKKRKTELSDAVASNDVTKLEDAIEWARFDGYQAELRDEIYHASRCIRQIADMERIRAAVRDLRQSVVSELRSYGKPPRMVHTVMLCTYLLLGVKEEKDLRRWQAIKTLLSQRGKNALKNLMMRFDRHHVKPEVASRVQELLAGFDLRSVCDVSEGAAIFYVWVCGMIQDT